MAGEMTDIWVWVEDGLDGREGTIAVAIPAMNNNISPLVHRNEKIAKGPFQELARFHRQRTGNRVRLLHFTNRTVDQELL